MSDSLFMWEMQPDTDVFNMLDTTALNMAV